MTRSPCPYEEQLQREQRRRLYPQTEECSSVCENFQISNDGADIPAFAKPTFERFRRTRHSAQYFDPDAAPIAEADAKWAIEKAAAALAGVKRLLATPPA